MAEVMYQGTGRRKTSVARVLLRAGEGKISINDKPVEYYFPREAWRIHALEPLQVTQTSTHLSRSRLLKHQGNSM